MGVHVKMELTNIPVPVPMVMRVSGVKPRPMNVPPTLASTRACVMILKGATDVTVCLVLQVCFLAYGM